MQPSGFCCSEAWSLGLSLRFRGSARRDRLDQLRDVCHRRHQRPARLDEAGPFDAAVSDVDRRYGFGDQALRLSDAVTSGSFGDQTFSPGRANEARAGNGVKLFDSSFRIGTALAARADRPACVRQPG